MRFEPDSFSPHAFFDCLALALRAPQPIAPFTITELHLFAYLACLLSVYEGEPVADWGYQFALTGLGYPFSGELDSAMQALTLRRHIEVDNLESVLPLDSAALEMAKLEEIPSFKQRLRWLQTSLDCSLAMPVSVVKSAVVARDDLSGAGVGGPRPLLSNAYVARVHGEREAIESALGGESSNLLAPAVAWLSMYILQGRELAA